MTPGSLLLGNAGHCFECGHEHAAGDRCIAFRFHPEYFQRLARDAGIRDARFRKPRLPPLREFSSLFARAISGLSGQLSLGWEELGIGLAGGAAQIGCGASKSVTTVPPSSEARVTRALRRIDHNPDQGLTLRTLASEAGLSAFHFLRVFGQITGLTPHQYILRTRLRKAATRLTVEPSRILDIALDSGFGDVSNFNRAFRGEFGLSPRAYRARSRAV
jgi:AraC-like DNA-binding protein